jgi:hypothetical protein
MEDTTAPVAEPATELVADDATSQPFVGRWKQLVSTTNWEKGRIIHEWREALIAADADRSTYADEVWSRTVRSVTPQHVGRLRRVFERFGDVCDQYAGLYWSHFQAALDWHDAEMWLEGGAQNRWSVAEMRRMRSETLGGEESQRPRDEEMAVAELNEDIDAQPGAPGKRPRGASDDQASDNAGDFTVVAEERSEAGIESRAAGAKDAIAALPAKRVRPFESLPPLPDDVADAFESMKLAILRHKAAEWQDIARDDLLVALDSLKELALAPTVE